MDTEGWVFLGLLAVLCVGLAFRVRQLSRWLQEARLQRDRAKRALARAELGETIDRMKPEEIDRVLLDRHPELRIVDLAPTGDPGGSLREFGRIERLGRVRRDREQPSDPAPEDRGSDHDLSEE